MTETTKKVVLFFPDTNERKSYFPPMSLMVLAAPLDAAGYDVVIVDARVHADWQKRIRAAVPGAVAFGVSSLTGSQIASGLAASELVRSCAPGITIVWGGWHPSILPGQTVADHRVDYVVVGQGEVTFMELLDLLGAMDGGSTAAAADGLAAIAGLAWQQNGEVMINPPRPITPLEQFPPPAFHLVDFPERYPGRSQGPEQVFTIYRTSIGCPYRCGFCADPLVYKRKYNMLPAARVIDELFILKEKYGVTDILFVDDTLLINEKRAKEICSLMLERKLGIRWQATVRTGTVTKIPMETWRLVKESGCTLLHPGVEASCQEMLDYIDKDEQHENTFAAAKILSAADIPALYSFIVCFPGEPADAIAQTFRVVRELKEINNDNVMPVNFYTPYPGNKLFDISVGHGFPPPQSLAEWAEFNTRIGNIPWLTARARDEVMKKDKYYFPAAYPSATLQRKMARGGIKYLYRFFHAISRWRVENDCFGFPLDWKLLLWYWRFWGRYARRWNLHDINFR